MRGVISEDHPHDRTEDETHDIDHRIEQERQVDRVRQRHRQAKRQQYTEQPTETAQHHCFGQELHPHFLRQRPDGEADADLARALRHADQHDVHDPDPADQKADRGYHRDDSRHRAGHVVDRLVDVGGIDDVEIVVLAFLDDAPLAQEIDQLLLDRGIGVGIVVFHYEELDVACPGKATLDRL